MYTWRSGTKRKNSELFPETFRCLIIGESNAGKSCLLFKLLLENYLDYNYLIVVGDSLYQENYKILKQMLESGYSPEHTRRFFEIQEKVKSCELNTEQIIDSLNRPNNAPITVEYFTSKDSIPDPSELLEANYCIVFDDIVTRKNQEIMKSYFTRGRHKNAIVFYLSQSYFALDRRAIRMNSNILILFRLSLRDMQNLHNDRIRIDMSFQEFKIFCYDVWREPYNFVMINFDCTANSGKRYRRNLDGFYTPTGIL